MSDAEQVFGQPAPEQPVPVEAPQEQPQAPVMAPPPPPQRENSVEDDVLEEEARDALGLEVTLAAEAMAKASRAMIGDNNHVAAENYAQATHKLIQGLVLLTPVTAADDLVRGGGASVPAGLAEAARVRSDQ